MCPECRVGHLQSGTAFYGRWVGDTFLTIPDFPAWICDVCGNREYDHLALHDLKATLGGPISGGRSPRRKHSSSEETATIRQPGRTE